MDRKTVLIKARELLSDSARWCQGSNAKDVTGRNVSPNGSDAVRFCARGAMLNVCGMRDPSDMVDYDKYKLFCEARHLAECCVVKLIKDGNDNGHSLVGANDRYAHEEPERVAEKLKVVHAEILSVFDCAIAAADQTEAVF